MDYLQQQQKPFVTDRLTQFVPQRVQSTFAQFAAAPVVGAPEGAKDPLSKAVGFDVGDTLLRIGETGIPFLPGGIGYVAGVPISLFVADKDARESLKKLTDTYREELAAHFHVPVAAVNEQMTLMAASDMPGIHEEIQAIYQKKHDHWKVNGMGLAGMASSMAAASVPISGFAALWGPLAPLGFLVGGGAVAIAGAYAGEHVGQKLFGSEEGEHSPMFHINHIEELRQEHKPITALDIFALRVAQNPELNLSIKDTHGKGFFKLDEQTKIDVMKQCDGLARCCAKDAAKCAQPETNVKALMFGMIPDTAFTPLQQQGVYQPVGAQQSSPQPRWQTRVSATSVRPAGFAQMIQAQRNQAIQAQTELG